MSNEKENFVEKDRKEQLELENNSNIEKQAQDIQAIRKDMSASLGLASVKEPKVLKSLIPNQYITGKRASQDNYFGATEAFYAKKRDIETQEEKKDDEIKEKKEKKEQEKKDEMVTSILESNGEKLDKVAQVSKTDANDNEDDSRVTLDGESISELKNALSEKDSIESKKNKAKLDKIKKKHSDIEENKRKNTSFLGRIWDDKVGNPINEFTDTFGEFIPVVGEYIKEQRGMTKDQIKSEKSVVAQMIETSTETQSQLPIYTQELTKLFAKNGFDIEQFTLGETQVLSELKEHQEAFSKDFEESFGQTVQEYTAEMLDKEINDYVTVINHFESIHQHTAVAVLNAGRNLK